MNLSQMRIMRELAERGTIAAVARHLHVTAPAISQQLAALHRELGVPLTYRVGREIRLTEAGMALAEMAGTVHTLIDRAAETVREYGDDAGARVRVAAFQSAGQALLPALLGGADSSPSPSPSLVFAEHDVAQPEFAVLVDQYDLVIAHRMDHDEPWPSEQLSVTTLLSEPFDVAMSVDHPLAERASVSAAELADESWIAAHAGFAPDVALGVVEATAGVKFHRAHRVNDYHLAASLIVGGELLALFPRYTAPRADPRLVLVPLEDVRIARNIDVLARPHALVRVAVAGTLERLRGAADALQRSRPQSPVPPGLHHIEVWLSDVEAERASWAWLLSRVGFTLTSEWSGGESWGAGDTYLTLTASPNLSAATHDRRRPGVNHLAFRGGSRDEVDAIMSAAPENGWRPLYQERYPHAGGEAHYAGWLENAAGFKVEVVADAVVSAARPADA